MFQVTARPNLIEMAYSNPECEVYFRARVERGKTVAANELGRVDPSKFDLAQCLAPKGVASRESAPIDRSPNLAAEPEKRNDGEMDRRSDFRIV